MSGRPEDDDELEELRQERLQELQEQQESQADDEAAAEAQEQAQQQAEAQKQAMLRKFLTDGARQRLNSVKMSKPDFGEKVEQQVLQVAQSGRVQGKIDEDQMKELLEELSPDSRRFDIRRR